MVILILSPTFHCANHTRGSMRVIPPVAKKLWLDYRCLLSSRRVNKISQCSIQCGLVIQVNNAALLVKVPQDETERNTALTRENEIEQQE